jgi:hypothetical protein
VEEFSPACSIYTGVSCATGHGTDVSCVHQEELEATALRIGSIGVIELTLKTTLDGNVRCGGKMKIKHLGRGSNPPGIETRFLLIEGSGASPEE